MDYFEVSVLLVLNGIFVRRRDGPAGRFVLCMRRLWLIAPLQAFCDAGGQVAPSRGPGAQGEGKLVLQWG